MTGHLFLNMWMLLMYLAIQSSRTLICFTYRLRHLDVILQFCNLSTAIFPLLHQRLVLVASYVMSTHLTKDGESLCMNVYRRNILILASNGQHSSYLWIMLIEAHITMWAGVHASSHTNWGDSIIVIPYTSNLLEHFCS